MKWRRLSLTGLARLGPPEGAAFVFLMEDKRPGFLRSYSRAVAEYLAQRLTGNVGLRVQKDSHGRPFLPGSRLNVSISHSGPCLMIALATAEVGVDIDYIRNPATWPDLYRWINCPEDRWPTPTEQEFLACWTAKESILKMLPGGFDYGVQRVSVPTSASGAWLPVWVDERRFYLRLLPSWKSMIASIALTDLEVVLPFLLTSPLPEVQNA